MLLRIVDDPRVARATVLRRHLPEEAELPEPVRNRIHEVFGTDLTADEAVSRIIAEVRSHGDVALHHFGLAFDGQDVGSLEVPPAVIDQAWNELPNDVREAMTLAAQRIQRFHERSLPRSWFDFDEDSVFGQTFRPIERVGVYAPGGRAVYPSTVLMSAIPARVAGVSSVILCSPPGPLGWPHPSVLAAARVSGVDRVFRVGGAQAIAALAHGTETVPSVDKVVGPGNIFVAIAKRLVFGAVGIDQIAGPTETLLVADESASPVALAADLLAQAEHDPMATALLITDCRGVAEATANEVERQYPLLPRREIIAESIRSRGAAVVAPSIDVAIELANAFAPEHLCLMIRDAWTALPKLRNAGGIFLGERSIEAIGDYTAGPSHVMPTGGSARFASPLSVFDFVKISSVFDVSAGVFAKISSAAVSLAQIEGLEGHAAAIRLRQGECSA